MQAIPFVAGAYESRSLPLSAQRTVNCYVEAAPEQTNNPGLIGIHGTTRVTDLTDIRALYAARGRLYCVAGSELYAINRGDTVTLLGTVKDDGLPAQMTHNIFEVLVISGGRGYVVQHGASSLTEITDTEFPNAGNCGFLDGYGLLREKESGRFWYTAIDDFESVNGIDFATAEGAPDQLVSLLIDHREVFLFGEHTIERWYNSGAANNPIQRSQGGFIEKGCRGAYSPAKLDNTVFWLSPEHVVYRLDDFPVRISNHGIEQLIAKTTVDPIAFAYHWAGHGFYQLNFPGELTVVYDVATGTWHERRMYRKKDCTYRYHAEAYGKHYVGGDRLYTLSDDVYTHDGEALERIRAMGPMGSDYFQTMSSLTLVMETGETNKADPQVMVRVSDDAGKTFKPPRLASVGRLGEYRRQVKLLGLGGAYANQRVVEVSQTDDAKFALVAVTVP